MNRAAMVTLPTWLGRAISSSKGCGPAQHSHSPAAVSPQTGATLVDARPGLHRLLSLQLRHEASPYYSAASRHATNSSPDTTIRVDGMVSVSLCKPLTAPPAAFCKSALTHRPPKRSDCRDSLVRYTSPSMLSGDISFCMARDR